MYEDFYRFDRTPFSLSPDLDFFYLSAQHEEALSLLEYGILHESGFVVITGETGCGKTTLIRHLLRSVPKNVTVGVITNTHPKFGELLKWILVAFELDYKDKEEIDLWRVFSNFLSDQHAEGRNVVLVLDEAQKLDSETLEQIRTLTNVSSAHERYIQVVLVGQPELLEILRRPGLQQLAQRSFGDCKILPFTCDETCAYIEYRLKVAGGDPNLFDDIARRAVHVFTSGIPRLINVLCDTSLVYGFAQEKRRIDCETVIRAAADKKRGEVSNVAKIAERLSARAIARRIAADYDVRVIDDTAHTIARYFSMDRPPWISPPPRRIISRS